VPTYTTKLAASSAYQPIKKTRTAFKRNLDLLSPRITLRFLRTTYKIGFEMNNRFFKKAATKTVFHGLAAWCLYQMLRLLESVDPDGSTLWEEILNRVIKHMGIPALASLGSEDLLNRLLGTDINAEMACLNCLTGIIIALYTETYFDKLGLDFTVPLTFYGMAFYYNYFCTPENSSELISSPGNQPR
jgi:hypothetical protein